MGKPISRRSGPIGAAAKTISEYIAGQSENLEAYRTDVEEGLGPELKVSRQYQDLFHLTPGFYMWMAKNTTVLWALTCRIMRGEQTFTGVMRNHRRLETALGIGRFVEKALLQ